jgi:hypothetical protein
MIETQYEFLEKKHPFMRKIFELKTKRIFTVAEARELLPLVYRMTEDANKELRDLMNQLKALGSSYNP